MAPLIRIKTDLAGDMRRLAFEKADLTYARLSADLAALYPSAAARLVLKYVDEDGDKITMSSDAELTEAVDSADTATLRLHLEVAAGAPAPGPREPASAGGMPAVAETAAATGAAAAAAARAAARRAAGSAANAAHAAQVAAEDAAMPDVSRHESTGVPELDQFINALGGLERFLPSFLNMVGVASAPGGHPAGAHPPPTPAPPPHGPPAFGAFFGPPPAHGPPPFVHGAPPPQMHPPMHPPVHPHMHAPMHAPMHGGPPPHMHGGPPHAHPHPHPHAHPHAHPHPHPHAHPGHHGEAHAHPHPHPHSHPGPHGERHGGRRGGPAGGRHGGPGGPPPMRAEFPWGNASAFGPMAGVLSAVQESLRNVSPVTRRAFEQMVGRIARAGQHFAAFAAVRESLPAARAWLVGSLGEAGALAQSAIEALIAALRPLVQPRLGQQAEAVFAFIRTALTDNAVVTMLRSLDPANLPEDMDGDVDIDVDVDLGRLFGMSGRRGAAGAGASRGGRAGPRGFAPTFDTHVGVECDGCMASPIVGDRFKSKSRANFDLCGVCHAEGSHAEAGEEFNVYKFPWEASNDSVVPPSPLGFRDRSPHVAHLQKILVQLGYMGEDMVNRAVGSFGPRTLAAVERFQREYGLEGSVQLGAYDELTRGALFSIVDSGVPVRAATGSSNEETGAGPSGQTTPVQEGTAQ